MAWRIDEHVVRGEIDNRARDHVVGRIWFAGLDKPVELDLQGNAWRDLAGRRLSFINPSPTPGELGSFALRQVGVVGDCTASRKVKVPDVSHDELMELIEAKQPFPWHWGNSLYFEWFSARNGRVVIESASFQLTIDPEATWEMSESEEETQRQANGEAMTQFMNRLVKAAGDEEALEEESSLEDDFDDEVEEDDEDEEDSWEAERPMTEAEAEEMQAESDRLADRIQARIEREGEDADIGKIIAEEIERRRKERGEEPLTTEEEGTRSDWVEQMNEAAQEALENPEIEAEVRKKHPLAERAFELSIRLHREPEEHGWIPQDASEEHPLVEMINSASCAGAKFAGALNGGSWPPDVHFCATKIVRLKRARDYIDDGLAAIDDCLDQKLADADWLRNARRELVELGLACDGLITELRELLERGFD